MVTCLPSLGFAANPNLVGWWSFDEGKGEVAADGSGHGNDGTLVNTTWEAGQLGSALGFDGTAYVDIPPASWVTISSQVTLAFWVHIPAANMNQSNFIVGAFSDPANNDARVFSAHLPWGGATVYFDTSGPGYDRTSKAITSAELTDAWNHWAFVKNADTGDVAIYRNGEVWHTATGLTKPLQGADITGFTVGTKPSLAEGWFTGMIDDVQLYNKALSQEEIQKAMQGISLEQATDPVPDAEAVDVLRDSVLSWTPGEFAGSHHLYLGTSFDQVDSATEPTASGLNVSSFDPGRLDFGTTYFWRVDEVNATPDRTVFKGDVWSFTVEPYSVMIPVDLDKVTASSSAADNPPGMTVNGSGLDGGTHSTQSDAMWLSAMPDLNPWLMVEFDDVQKLDTMLIWNANSASEGFVGWGMKDVNIETSMDGVTWTPLGAEPIQVSRAPGLPTYGDPHVIDFGLVQGRYVKINILNNWGGVVMQYGISEIQFYGLPVAARMPVPASGSVDVLPGSVASWRAGREAGQHTIYVSTDANAVADGTAPSVSSTTNSVNLGSLDLELGQTYYWRVDEVNEAEVPSVWTGPVWSFDTVEAVAVDDFEGYNNFSPDRPFQAWIDGFGYSADEFFPVANPGNGTGAGAGHDIWSPSSPHYDGQIMEETMTIAGSEQSLPLYYNNAGGTSHIDRTFAVPQDWTTGAPQTLVLWVHGQSTNAAANTLYLKVNNAKVTYDGDISVPIWKSWHVDLASLGTNLSAVTSLSIGVEGSGSGLIYLDDISLYRIAPPVVEPPAGSDPSLVGYWKLDETEGLTAVDSSGYGNHGTLVGMTGTEWTTGKFGGALTVTGASSATPKYVRFENVSSLQLYDSATISAWVKMNEGNAGAYMGIAGKLVSGYYKGFSLVRHSSNVFRLWCDDGNGVLAGHEASSNDTYTDTEWHHLVGVVDDGTSTLYVDGVKQDMQGEVDLTDSGTYAHIGKQYGDDSSHRYWNGLVDEVRIYYRALTEQEISGL
jgi:hypothetical protein